MFGRIIIAISWVVTLISTIAGAAMLWEAVKTNMAPAQGAAAAVACGLAVVPYVFTRALESLQFPRKD